LATTPVLRLEINGVKCDPVITFTVDENEFGNPLLCFKIEKYLHDKITLF